MFTFCLAYPLAYTMAFKAGRWRNVMLICVVAPFFTSFILRTIAWRQILADDSPVVRTLNALNLLPGGHLTETWVAVVAGLTYNFLPFMVLPIYASLERADPRLIEAGGDLYANGFTDLPHGHGAAEHARHHRRHAADLHPGGRRLRQRRAARVRHQHQDGRQRHREPVLPGPRRLPGRRQRSPSRSWP